MKVFATLFAIILLAVGAAAQSPRSVDADRALRILETSDTQAAFDHLVGLLASHGADIDTVGKRSRLKLNIRDYKEIINSYDNWLIAINVSRMVSRDEAASYWENWSKTLTNEQFDQARFFADDDERKLMANLNVLILMAHEIGHYLDYRYKISDIYWDGGAIVNHDALNCSEGVADNFAVAVLEHLAANKRFDRLRTRYIEMITAFNEAIPEANRYKFASPLLADEQCAATDLLENGVTGREVNENFFRQYASAYFNRHLVKLKKRFGLTETIRKYLVAPFVARMNYSTTPINLRTVGKVAGYDGSVDVRFRDEADRRDIFWMQSMYTTEDEKPVDSTLRSITLNEKGDPRLVEIKFTAEKIRGGERNEESEMLKGQTFSLKVSTPDGKILVDKSMNSPGQAPNFFQITSFLMPTDNEFISILVPVDMTDLDKDREKFDHIHLLVGRRVGSKWQAAYKKFRVDGLTDADEFGTSWHLTPSGKLRVFRRQPLGGDGSYRSTLYEIDRNLGNAKQIGEPFISTFSKPSTNRSHRDGIWRQYNWGLGMAANDRGRRLLPGWEMSLQMVSDENIFEVVSQPQLLVGNFSGHTDGSDPLKMKIGSVSAHRFSGPNRYRFVAGGPDGYYLREIVFR